MTRKDNWQALYAEWHGILKRYIKSHRGAAAKIARHLGVSRQTVHRWTRYQPIPGWAVFAIHTTVRLGSDRLPEPDFESGEWNLKPLSGSAVTTEKPTAKRRVVRLGSDKPAAIPVNLPVIRDGEGRLVPFLPEPRYVIPGTICDEYGRVANSMESPLHPGGINCGVCKLIVRAELFPGLNTGDGGKCDVRSGWKAAEMRQRIREAMAA